MCHIDHKRMTKKNAWAWVPTLYFAEGLPYVAVMTISVVMYKKLEINNAQIALYTSWLYLPWVIKPLWSPFVDMFKTKRWWIFTMQLLIGACFAGVAFTIPTTRFFQSTLAIFWLMAFSSSTHDIAADGFYMLGLNQREQSLFVGIRNTFYRLANIFGQGILIMIAGSLEVVTGNIPRAWFITFLILSAMLIAMGLYHRFILPRPIDDHATPVKSFREVFATFWEIIASFFKKGQVWVALAFMLLFRLPEAQLVKIINPFLLDPINKGGLGLTTTQVGFAYGVIGVIGLLIGGILGGIAISQGGLKRWLWPMVWAISLPDLVYVYMSFAQPHSLLIIDSCIFVEQFGYGFGFTAYSLFLIYYAQGNHKTAHYALATAFMALGMMLPGMVSGYIQEALGYSHFFVWVILCCAATFGVAALLKIDPEFGKKRA